jgi:hypothetical protein
MHDRNAGGPSVDQSGMALRINEHRAARRRRRVVAYAGVRLAVAGRPPGRRPAVRGRPAAVAWPVGLPSFVPIPRTW